MSSGRARSAKRCSHPLSVYLLLVCTAASTRPTAVAAIPSPTTATVAFFRARNGQNVGMAPKAPAATADDENAASVLRELKGTVRAQAAEIARLKQALAATSAPAATSGGHGHGPAVDNDDILAYARKSFLAVACDRVGWLGFFLFSLSFTALIMNGFEHTLSRQIELAYFVPLLIGHGGNTGGQAVGTVLSALSAGAVTRRDAGRVVAKEALSGLSMGIILGACVGPISHYAMGVSMHVATVVSVTMPLLSTIAAALGSALPFLCVVLGLDPAVIAAPAMTSMVDVTGLLCYFLIANRIFRLFGIDL